MKIANNICELIGNTPLVKLNKISNGFECSVLVKLECFNPSFSIKDRTALSMVLKAESEGLVNKDTVFIEPTSGNTGIALAQICAIRGYKLILTMPETMSDERKQLLSAFGAELILTPVSEGMNGAVRVAQELVQQNKNYLMLQQFSNPANPDIHYKTTAEEIWNDTDGKVNIVVAGIGTSGTLMGISRKLKENNPRVYIVGVEPSNSPVLSQGKSGVHGIQGIGAGFIPKIYDKNLIDEIITIDDELAVCTAKRLTKEEGILAGISSGANVAASINVAKRKTSSGKIIVTILPDSSERYLSTNLYK